MAATECLMFCFRSRIVCGFDSYTVLFKCPRENLSSLTGDGKKENFLWDTWKVQYTNEIRTRYMNWSTTSVTQLQPSQSPCYIRYTSTRLDVRSCVLMQEATIFSIFYDGISFHHFYTVLISVFILCYGSGLLFRGPSVFSPRIVGLYFP